MTSRSARLRVAVGFMAWSAITTVLAGVARDSLPAVLDGSADQDGALTALAALLGLALTGWLALAVVATILSELLPSTGGTVVGLARWLSRVITPAVLRQMLAIVITGALVSGTAPARATVPTPAPVATVSAAASLEDARRLDPGGPAGDGSVTSGLDPGWASTPWSRHQESPSPTRSATTFSSLDPSWGAPDRVRAGSYPDEKITVRRGDTLWAIAARYLGPAATDAEIAETWPHWFTANRATIGPDPDRLAPGQRLHPPAPLAGGQP
jgi:hypothetical protein